MTKTKTKTKREKEETKEGKDNGSKEGSRGMEDMGWRRGSSKIRERSKKIGTRMISNDFTDEYMSLERKQVKGCQQKNYVIEIKKE